MTSFVFWMLVASALGFLKALGLAAVMTRGDFGDYNSRFYLATLAASLVSVGMLERTIKSYPRRWAEGNIDWIQADSRAIVRTLAIRFFWILLALLVVGLALDRLNVLPFRPVEAMLTALLAMGSAWLVLLASVYRAAGSQAELQRFHLQRTTGALVLAFVGGWQFGWRGALAGDVAASAISIAWSNLRLRIAYRSRREGADPLVTTDALPSEIAGERGHHELYAANILSSTTMQADRSIVRGALGPAVAGTYGLVMMIPAVAQMLVNVIVQFIGPLIIKFAHAKHRDRSRISALGLQAALLAVFSLFLAAAVVAGKRLPFVADMLAKYAISDLTVLLAAAAAAGQIYSVIEFHLIARDRERDILLASVAATAVFGVVMLVATLMSASIEWFVAAGVAARGVQVWILSRAYRKMTHGEAR